ncbi:hypothetical protein NPIL_431831 [Nephila pilipes]|uniref:Uncharacterized protein n=1 Tax=Nephila pilipes TaxID=299642 RepID=A0A8X6TTN6_NEPPI|nr:hypothetical protein NPIL_431831 [Nephila pilipes]
MNSVQQLLQHYIKPGLTTIVYGNLATRYDLIKYYLDLMFDDLNIEFRTKEPNIELYCDVLVWFNPEFGEHVYRPNHARVIKAYTILSVFQYRLESLCCKSALESMVFGYL